MPRSRRRFLTTLPLIMVALATLAGGRIAQAGSPPISCRKATLPSDREICGSAEFLAMDREIVALYDRGMTQFVGDDRHRLVLSQQSFLRQRTSCDWAAHHSAHPGVAVEECIRTKMEARVHSLRQMVDRGGS